MTLQEITEEVVLNSFTKTANPKDDVEKKCFKVVKEALEKQIPKSPALSGDGYSEGNLVYDTWECPNCGEQYEVDYDDYDYCPKCGQAIDKSVFDWEEGGTSD